MKKPAAILLMLCMVLSVTAALAEPGTYVMIAVTDTEGNTVFTEDMPVLLFVIDDETMECAFGTDGEVVGGTVELFEPDEEGMAAFEEIDGADDKVDESLGTVIGMYVTFEDGSEMIFFYVAETDTMHFIDENGYIYSMLNLDSFVSVEEAA